MKQIQLNDGTIINSYDDRMALEGIIYDYLGSDAYRLFDNYVDNLFEQIDELNREIEEWKQEVTIWENGGHDE